jgi:hypothetical protein
MGRYRGVPSRRLCRNLVIRVVGKPRLQILQPHGV